MPQPLGPDAGKITDIAHRVSVEIDVSSMVTRLENEALRLINDLSQQGLSGDDLVDAVKDGLRELSDKWVDDKGRGAATESFNLGRNLEAQRQEDLVEVAVRSEVLDEETCAPCRKLDFEQSEIEYVVGTDKYFEDMPPNGCLGRQRCRGFYIFRRVPAEEVST